MKEILKEWKNFLAEQHTYSISYTERIIPIIMNDEKFREEPYDDKCPNTPRKDCKGTPTIGYGTTIYLPQNVRVTLQDKKIDQKTAIQYIKVALNEIVVSLNKKLVKDLNENQFDALCLFAYNVGLGKLYGSQLFKKININPNDKTIPSEFAKPQFMSFKDEENPKLREKREFEAKLYATPAQPKIRS